MAGQKKKKSFSDMWWDFAAIACYAAGVFGAGYMLFTGESIGWIIAGFFGGFFGMAVGLGLISAPFVKSKPDPVFEAANNKRWQRVAYNEFLIRH